VPFTNACRAYERGKFDGIGFVLGDGFVGVDLDGCRNPETGALDQWAIEALLGLSTYSEVSPSGSGVKAIALADNFPLVRNRKHSGEHCGVEVYVKGRYFCLTGRALAEYPCQVNRRPKSLAKLVQKHLGPDALQPGRANEKPPAASMGTAPCTPEPPPAPFPTLPREGEEEDDRVLRRALRHAKFAKLFRGDWKDDKYATQSQADYALVCLLCYYTNRNADQMDRLFRRSQLMRQKWNDRRGPSTWGRQRIEKAIAKVTAFTDSKTHGTQIDTKDTNTHPLCLSVSSFPLEALVFEHVPDAPPKDLWREMLSFARLLMGHARDLQGGVASMQIWVRRWFNAAGDALASFGWEKVWATFLDVYEHVLAPAGAGKLDYFYAQSLAAPFPAEAALYKTLEQRRLLALCHALAKQTRQGTFFLDCRSAALRIGRSKSSIHSYLKGFMADGVLTLVCKGTRASAHASDYRWVGRPEARAAA